MNNIPLRRAILQWIVLLSSAIIVLAIDQMTKAWVTGHMLYGETLIPIPALQDFITLTRSSNTGAAFSLLPQAGDLFLIIALVMIIVILLFYRRIPNGHWLERIALGLLLGGVAGNALDRLRLGYVVDFVHLQLRPFISNVSNIADHAIVVGIGILFIVQWTGSKASTPPTPSKVDQQPEETPPVKL